MAYGMGLVQDKRWCESQVGMGHGFIQTMGWCRSWVDVGRGFGTPEGTALLVG